MKINFVIELYLNQLYLATYYIKNNVSLLVAHFALLRSLCAH